jgi:hypothetical protein
MEPDPKVLLQEVRDTCQDPSSYPRLLELYCTSKTRALKLETSKWINALPPNTLLELVGPMFVDAFTSMGDLLDEQAKMQKLTRILDIKTLTSLGLDTTNIETYATNFLARFLTVTLPDVNAFEVVIRVIV